MPADARNAKADLEEELRLARLEVEIWQKVFQATAAQLPKPGGRQGPLSGIIEELKPTRREVAIERKNMRTPKITDAWMALQTVALLLLVFVPASPDRTRLVPAPVDGLQGVAAAQVVAVEGSKGALELCLAGMDSRTPPEPSLALSGVGTVAESGEMRILGTSKVNCAAEYPTPTPGPTAVPGVTPELTPTPYHSIQV